MADKEWTDLMPDPGHYNFPAMDQTRITGADLAGFVKLHFQAERQVDGQTQKLTMSVPISVLDAAALLRSLRILQQKGIVPSVLETPRTADPN